MYGYKCPYCGANLDPGEKCDCRKDKEYGEERNLQEAAANGAGE